MATIFIKFKVLFYNFKRRVACCIKYIIHRGLSLLNLDGCIRTLVEGCEHDSFKVKMIPPPTFYQKGTVRVIEKFGSDVSLDLSNLTDHAGYFGYTDLGDRFLRSIIKKDFYIIDVGGNIGLKALEFGWLAPQGKVYSIEPDPTIFPILVENTSGCINNNISSYNFGFGNEIRRASLISVCPWNNGMNRIVENQEKFERYSSEARVEIELCKLDDFVMIEGLHKLDLIKIDAEGYEFEILNGSICSLLRFRPIVFIEIDSGNLANNNSTPGRVLKFLSDINYSIFDLTWRELNSQDSFTNCHLDVICIPWRDWSAKSSAVDFGISVGRGQGGSPSSIV